MPPKYNWSIPETRNPRNPETLKYKASKLPPKSETLKLPSKLETPKLPPKYKTPKLYNLLVKISPKPKIPPKLY